MKLANYSHSLVKSAALWLAATSAGIHAKGFDSNEMVGSWQFVKLIYRSEDLPPQNPNFIVRLELNENQESRLLWSSNEVQSVCEVRGTYKWDGHLFENQIKWINPHNPPSCNTNAETQIGIKTSAPAWIFKDNLHIDLGPGSESFIYVWKKTSL